MTGASRSAPAGERAQGEAWGRCDTALFALAATTLALLAAQFALAGLGAFTMDKTPADNVYAAHEILGVVICALTGWLMAETGRRRAAARRLTGTSGTQASGTQAGHE